ncbi:MAG: hypothetical protein ACI83P_000230 [Janthinobacterium sp.]|jgi:hypothetical protein
MDLPCAIPSGAAHSKKPLILSSQRLMQFLVVIDGLEYSLETRINQRFQNFSNSLCPTGIRINFSGAGGRNCGQAASAVMCPPNMPKSTLARVNCRAGGLLRARQKFNVILVAEGTVLSLAGHFCNTEGQVSPVVGGRGRTHREGLTSVTSFFKAAVYKILHIAEPISSSGKKRISANVDLNVAAIDILRCNFGQFKGGRAKRVEMPGKSLSSAGKFNGFTLFDIHVSRVR